MQHTILLPFSRKQLGTPHTPSDASGAVKYHTFPHPQTRCEKRRARGRWQPSRNKCDRDTYNRLKRNLQTAMKEARNATFEQFITSISPDDTSLWKATKSFKRPQVSIPPIRKSDGSWAKSDTDKSADFGDHLHHVFTPHSFFHTHDFVVSASLDVPCPMSLTISPFSLAEMSAVIARLNVHKAPGYDLISGKVLRELPPAAVALHTTLFNSILRLSY